MQKQAGYVRANDGVRLYYEEAGSGKPIVLIHGGGLSLAWWKRNFPALAEKFHVIAADTRGCGRSDKPLWGHRTARYAKDVFDIIEALGLFDVTLVGWSVGARTCYSYLELFGHHRLRGVVIVDETVHASVHEPPPDGSAQREGESDEEFARRMMRIMASPQNPDALPDEELGWMMDTLSDLPAAQGLSADYQAQDWRHLCPVIIVPVLVATGRHSGARPGCEYAANHIPGATLVVFENSGHALAYTEAEKFNRVVADFVDGVPLTITSQTG